jgi:hypothetical protein
MREGAVEGGEQPVALIDGTIIGSRSTALGGS